MASSSPPPPHISSSDLAAAAERRLQQQQGPSPLELQFSGAEHDLRQKFRRLIDPGILRPNPKAQALQSLKTLLLISDNLLRESDNPKYQRFKPTNSLIKRDLIDPKGTVEYARELGFYPEVEDFQPYYTFNPRRMVNLRIGADMLREVIALESDKQARAVHSKKEEKAVADAAAEKIRLAYEDDRKMKLMRDQLEKERRDARIAAARRAELRDSAPQSSPDEEGNESEDEGTMPGAGNKLGPRPTAPSDKKTD
ncbi:hypothetical protein B0H15DRAFT_112395 [Mycena belliarum]|uniref:PUB domain-containing protein n=1 Tax=Mycena belliarum TaxID=1033014 RepID=A0AAD6XTY9_9AGAR|nr:hypothetical protein B0H15DRAFT_112395 [Mycena belliae]